MQLYEQIPSFDFNATNKLRDNFDSYRGKWLILYFYPKDATPGCTRQGCAFRDDFEAFQKLNTVIFGVSRDPIASHERFKSKEQFPFELIADPEEQLCLLFDVIKMKNNYGKQVRGIERSTFLFDDKGVLRHVWRKVNVQEHSQEILTRLKELQSAA